jgi:carbon-monoxide dehydrogenase medium subunit
MRTNKAENFLAGQQWQEDLLEEVANIASGEAAPITDIRATKEYRREMIRALVKKALKTAWNRTDIKTGDSLE